MKRIIIVSITIPFLLFFYPPSFCQSGSLSIGDTCPDILIKHVVNYKSTEVRLADFKGRLLILDFWATWCAPCVSMIPTSDSLQKNFGDKIQILPVTDQDSVTVTRFIKSMNRYHAINITSVTNDRTLQSLFPHVEIPHYVWIDENSIVVAITGSDQFTAANINNFLANKNVALNVKKDVTKIIDSEKPMFAVGNELIEGNKILFDKTQAPDLLYHSVITKYSEGFGCETHLDSSRITCKNNSIGGLYRMATGGGQLRSLLLNKTVWDVSNAVVKKFTDSAAFSMTENSTRIAYWMKNYCFCYELLFPPLTKDKKFEVMLNDLNSYFGTVYNIHGGLERRKTKCYVLVKTGYNASFYSKGIDGSNVFDEYHLTIKNGTIRTLLDMLGINLDTLPPLVDETDYNGKIDIDLQCNLTDINSVNEALAKYGLNLKETEKEMEMLVIKDRPVAK